MTIGMPNETVLSFKNELQKREEKGGRFKNMVCSVVAFWEQKPLEKRIIVRIVLYKVDEFNEKH